MFKRTVLLMVILASAFSLQAGNKIVDRPEKLKFGPLDFKVPDAAALRFELSDGTPVYLKEDHELPLVDLTIFFHGGRYLIPAEKAGLAGITSDVWRSGGAGDMSAREFDAKFPRMRPLINRSLGFGNFKQICGQNRLSFLR